MLSHAVQNDDPENLGGLGKAAVGDLTRLLFRDIPYIIGNRESSLGSTTMSTKSGTRSVVSYANNY